MAFKQKIIFRLNINYFHFFQSIFMKLRLFFTRRFRESRDTRIFFGRDRELELSNRPLISY
jgi:hypothetical protein